MRDSCTTGAFGAFLVLGLSATLGAQGAYTNLGSGDASSVSADGTVVVGSGNGTWRWTATGGRVTIRAFEGIGGQVAVSGDGNTVVTNIKDGNGDPVGGIWDSINWTSLGYLPNALRCPSRSSVYDISADGTTAVGLSWDGCSGRAFKWDAINGMIDLPQLGSRSARANAVSADGMVIGGWEQSPTTGGRRAAVWFPGGSEVLIVPPHAANTEGRGEVWSINSDGTVIVGGEGLNGLEPFRWTLAGGYETLGRIPGVNLDPPFAYATNEDGSMVAGGFGNAFGAVAFMWTEEDGMRRFDDFLADQGIALPAGGALAYVFDISPDGGAIVGRRTTSQFGSDAFLVNMPEGFRYGVNTGGNNTLDLSGTGSRQIGGNLVVTTSNVTGSLVSTVIGLKSTRLPIFGGTLLVDLSLPHLVWNAQAVGGTSLFNFPVPNDPNLVGVSLYMQSLVLGQSILFSNGMKTTFSG